MALDCVLIFVTKWPLGSPLSGRWPVLRLLSGQQVGGGGATRWGAAGAGHLEGEAPGPSQDLL